MKNEKEIEVKEIEIKNKSYKYDYFRWWIEQ